MSMEKKSARACAAILLSLAIGSAPSIAAAAEVKEKAAPEVKAKASAQKIAPKFTLSGGKICGDKALLGKAACEGAAKTAYPGYNVTCTATNVALDKDCNVTSADCSCNGTAR